MANPLRGEVPLPCGDQTYMLRFSINALASLEDELDMPIAAVAALLSDESKLRLGTLRLIFRAALSDRHPELSLEQVGDIMQAAGINTAAAALGRAFAAAFPSAEGAEERPRKPKQDGTGKPS